MIICILLFNECVLCITMTWLSVTNYDIWDELSMLQKNIGNSEKNGAQLQNT